MRKYFLRSHLYLLAFAFAFISLNAQGKFNLSDKMPIDKDVKIGTLPNGMKYYIKANKKPAKRAELRLALNAGSVLENDSQRGLAHFLEHMEFNGTKNFPKNDLIKYLQSIGMRFGGDLNAYTSFDETVYMLQIPTDNDEQFERGMQVIEDWAHNTSLTDKDIDDERGVIMEEWRLGKGAGDRVRNKQMPITYYGSRYKDRLPIGDTAVIEHFSYETLRNFYHDWYRPDLMAVIAVGDFDVNKVEAMIKEKFSRVERHKNPPARTVYDMPMHKEKLASVATDKELGYTMVSALFKKPDNLAIRGTYAEFKSDFIGVLVSSMLNDRLKEITRKPDAPFTNASGGVSGFTRTAKAFNLRAVAKENRIIPAYETMLVELFRAVQNGFTDGELKRAKTEYVSLIESYYKEKDKSESADLASEYVKHFLTGEEISGIEHEFDVTKDLSAQIKLADVNNFIKDAIDGASFVATASMPEKESIIVPLESDLLASYKKVASLKYDAYQDEENDKPLFSKKVTPGKITSEKKLEAIDATELTLSNGVKVIIKSTDFKDDEILISGNSPGGFSLVDEADYYTAALASQIASQSGVGEFSKTILNKKLAGIQVSVKVGLTELAEVVNGSSSIKDLETALQLINLNITSPRFEKDAFSIMMSAIRESLKNNGSNPKSVFGDSVNAMLYQHHYRAMPLKESDLNSVTLEKAEKIFKERFANAGDFTFVFVGNVNLATIKPLLEKYLGSLPSANKRENWKDDGKRMLKESAQSTIYKGVEKQAQVSLNYTSEFKDNSSLERYKISALREIFTMKLLDSIREKRGGVYSIGAREGLTKIPYNEFRMSVMFGCDPDRTEELSNAIQELVVYLQTKPIEDLELTRVKETQRRAFEKSVKENGFWFNVITSAVSQDEDPAIILQRPKYIENLTAKDIQDMAIKYLSDKRLIKNILLPESYKK